MVMILICIYYSQFSNNWQALKKYNSMDTRKRRFMYIALGGRRELEKTGGGRIFRWRNCLRNRFSCSTHQRCVLRCFFKSQINTLLPLL